MAKVAPLPFDLRSLEVFVALCEDGSMARAARRLGITQPSVSQTLADLEARTGVQLFDRRVRPLGLTQPGSLLRQRATMLLAEARQIGPLLHQAGQGRLPFLRVGLVDSLTRALTAPLACFLAEAAVQSSILSGLTASHANALLTRQLDMFLGAEDVEDMDSLERFLLLEEAYVVLCPETMEPPRDLDDLARLGAELPLIRYSARSRTGLEVERHLKRLRLEFPHFQEYDTPHGVTSAVEAGLGWAITTPLCTAEAALPAGTARRHPLPGPALLRRLVLIARRRALGTVPERVAALCRSALGTTIAEAP